MPGSADLATQPAGAKGARPPSQGPRLDALAIAQLTGGVRLVSADAEAQLARFADPALLHSGKINLISLEAVQHRLGDRWLQKREQVFDFAEKVLERAIGVHGVYLRVSDTDYFVIQPDLGRFAGQASCLHGHIRWQSITLGLLHEVLVGQDQYLSIVIILKIQG